MGEIHSKYLILEVMGYAGYHHNTLEYMGSSSKNLRKLIVENHKLTMHVVMIERACYLCFMQDIVENYGNINECRDHPNFTMKVH